MWDVATQLSCQIRDTFPLQEAFLLGEAVGYSKEGLALLLPAISAGLTKAMIKLKVS